MSPASNPASNPVSNPASNPVFDRLLDDATAPILAGEHRRDEPPVDGGRWPVSVVAIPDEATRDVLAGVMDQALVHAGADHVETGRTDASHLTVRALEPYREAASPGDAVSAAWTAALDAVARTSPPVRLRLTGVTLTTGGVLVQAEPVDDAPWQLMEQLRAELGALAWFEDQGGPRDIWYSSVLHFAAPLLDPSGLLAWARRNRRSLQHEVVLDALSLVRFRHTERSRRRHMAMEHWHRAPLTGPAHHLEEPR